MIFDLSNIVLALTQSDPNGSVDQTVTYVAIGSFAAVAAIAVSSVFSFYSEKRQRNSTLLETLQSFSAKLSDLTQKEGSLSNKADCQSYAMNYLDIVDAIAYTYKKKIIPPDVINYFDNNFLYALLLREWLIENKIIQILKPEYETWSDLISFCKKHENVTFNSENRMETNYDNKKWNFNNEIEKLPFAMQQYDRLPDDAREKAKLQ
jgi:hypothetical protein